MNKPAPYDDDGMITSGWAKWATARALAERALDDLVTCGGCQQPATRCRVRVASGWHVTDWCYHCDRAANWRRAWLPRSERGDPMQYPERRSPTLDREPDIDERCAVCDAEGPTECHHFAPRALFGDEANRWPTAHICRPCHERWHSLVWRGGRP